MSTPFQIPRPVRSGAQPPSGSRQRPAAPPKPEVNKIKHGGGFNVAPSINLSFVKAAGTAGPAATAASGAAAPGRTGTGTPGAGFASNEDIHAFAEHVRKHARNLAVERSLDAEQLEATLRHIPSSDGSMVGAWMRARRVSRHLKKIANAEQLIAKEAAALYAQFQREYESELNQVGKGRTRQNTRTPFAF